MGSIPTKEIIRAPFIEHVYELRRRLLICLAFVLVGAGVGYWLNEFLLAVIQKPLGQKLFYTSPTGGFSFVFMICVVFGIVFALPCITYQIIAFLKPVLPHSTRRSMIIYPLCSVILAALGITFAYFVSLPASLHFLTNFGNSSIQSLITTDTYFNFALSYIGGFAILFQLPLLLVIINRITPLKPGKLMKWQRYVIVGSFITAAMITPTPDPFNQLLMAGPIIVLYQLSIVLVWLINRSKKTNHQLVAPVVAPVQERSAPLSLALPVEPRPQPTPTRRLISDIGVPQRQFQQRAKAPIAHRSQALKPAPRTRPNPQWNGGLLDIVIAR